MGVLGLLTLCIVILIHVLVTVDSKQTLRVVALLFIFSHSDLVCLNWLAELRFLGLLLIVHPVIGPFVFVVGGRLFAFIFHFLTSIRVALIHAELLCSCFLELYIAIITTESVVDVIEPSLSATGDDFAAATLRTFLGASGRLILGFCGNATDGEVFRALQPLHDIEGVVLCRFLRLRGLLFLIKALCKVDYGLFLGLFLRHSFISRKVNVFLQGYKPERFLVGIEDHKTVIGLAEVRGLMCAEAEAVTGRHLLTGEFLRFDTSEGHFLTIFPRISECVNRLLNLLALQVHGLSDQLVGAVVQFLLFENPLLLCLL